MIENNKLANAFGEDAILHHVGIAVKSIKKVNPDVTVYTDPIQKVKVAFIDVNGTCLELVEPLGEESPVTKFLKKGQSIYHMCYRVKDINASIESGRKNGFHCIAKPVEAVAFNQKKIAWLYNGDLGLFELVEA